MRAILSCPPSTRTCTKNPSEWGGSQPQSGQDSTSDTCVSQTARAAHRPIESTCVMHCILWAHASLESKSPQWCQTGTWWHDMWWEAEFHKSHSARETNLDHAIKLTQLVQTRSVRIEHDVKI